MTACAGGQPEGKIYPGVGSHRISRLRSLHLECEIIFSCWLRVSMGYRVRRHGSKFTIRVPSSAELANQFLGIGMFLLRDFTHRFQSAALTFLGRRSVAAEGECSGVAGSRNYIS